MCTTDHFDVSHVLWSIGDPSIVVIIHVQSRLVSGGLGILRFSHRDQIYDVTWTEVSRCVLIGGKSEVVLFSIFKYIM